MPTTPGTISACARMVNERKLETKKEERREKAHRAQHYLCIQVVHQPPRELALDGDLVRQHAQVVSQLVVPVRRGGAGGGGQGIG